MSRMSLFNSPLMLGFDHIERMLDHAHRSSNEGYPPYNIERIGERSLRISLALAGFSKQDLEISVEENQLTIKGQQAEDPDRMFLHRGIAARQFRRSFVLAEGMQVTGARLHSGLLHIDLERPEAVSTRRVIDIETQAEPVVQMTKLK